MKPLAALAALLIAAGSTSLPAFARPSYVIDNAHLLSTAAVTQINTKVGDFNTQTRKEVIVDTEPTLTGASIDAMAERTFAQHQINGVLILITKQPKKIGVYVDRASTKFFPTGTTSSIRQAMVSSFNTGDFDGGVNNGVDLSLSIFRSHLTSLRTSNGVPAAQPVRNETGGGFNMSFIFWLIALTVIFFIVRGIFRAMAGPRMMPPGYGGGPGMGGPGYGGGYGGGGFGGGGGGFFSGLLGGLGGAFLGNELFGNRGGFGGGEGTQQAGFVDPNAGDAGGWQNDAGQIDTSASSSGGYGDSGGGGWGGGGDSGGGWGGGDSGGGGGDSGGGGW